MHTIRGEIVIMERVGQYQIFNSVCMGESLIYASREEAGKMGVVESNVFVDAVLSEGCDEGGSSGET